MPNTLRFSTSMLLVVLAIGGVLVSCDSNDPRFKNAPTITAADVHSKNAATLSQRRMEEERRKAEAEARQQMAQANDHDESQGRTMVGSMRGGMGGKAPNIPPAPTAAPIRPEAGMETFASIDSYGKTGPLRWTAPTGWRGVKPGNSFRIAEYVVPGANGATSATLSIFHFPGGAGGIQANISRWLSQFTSVDGSAPTTTTENVGGLKVWRVKAAGVFNPGMSAGPDAIREDYKLNGAIVETSVGPFFFKLVGPRPTIDGSSAQFEDFVKSFHLAE